MLFSAPGVGTWLNFWTSPLKTEVPHRELSLVLMPAHWFRDSCGLSAASDSEGS